MTEEIVDALERGLNTDKAIYELCKVLVERCDVLASEIRIQNLQIRLIERRLNALLEAFYSHCESSSSTSIE